MTCKITANKNYGKYVGKKRIMVTDDRINSGMNENNSQ